MMGIRFIPSFKVVRRVWIEKRELRIDLGKHWEIMITVQAADAIMNKAVNIGVKKERLEFIKKIKELGVIPRWYGFAYVDFDTETGVYMPIPFNALVAWGKGLLFKLRFDWPHRWYKDPLHRAYKAGYLAGFYGTGYKPPTL